MADRKNPWDLRTLLDQPEEMRPTALAAPTWVPVKDSTITCPNCGANVCQVTVDVVQPLIKGGRGTAVYLGCPACPWASPSVIVPLP